MSRQQLNARTLLALTAIALMAACRRPPDPPATLVDPAPPASLAARDSGADLRADVDNARAAIADKSDMAAVNDVIQASSFAVQLPDLASTLHRHEASAPGPGGDRASPAAPTPLTAFEAEVLLTTAQSKLENGDLAGADAALAAIQQRAPMRLIPADLPLLRANQSLDLARIAVESDDATELKTQLSVAATSLAAYRGARHAADAAALAAAIDRTLRQPGSLEHLQSDRLDAWADQVDSWG